MKYTYNWGLLCLLLWSGQAFAQAGLTVSPGKIYFKVLQGGNASKKILVSNPNRKELQVGVSINDWDYDAYGNNRTYDAGTLKTSCANWVQVLPGSYFTLQPGEQKEITVLFTVPASADTGIPVHTAMLFLTQLNPGDSRDKNGSILKVSVRVGVKLYHSFSQTEEKSLEVLNFTDQKGQDTKGSAGFLELEVLNNGKVWLESKIKWELLNTQTGEKISLSDQESFSLPGDQMIIRQNLPPNFKAGHYNATAIINYGNKDELKIVELEFQR